jgi:hypothetical protein
MERCCLFSGLKPDTQEHVISDWIQRRFELQLAKYNLPNASGLDYRHAKVPANKSYNEMFGRIETRVSQNKFLCEEVYLWLFKIHVGLMYCDSFLRSDVRDPASNDHFKHGHSPSGRDLSSFSQIIFRIRNLWLSFPSGIGICSPIAIW